MDDTPSPAPENKLTPKQRDLISLVVEGGLLILVIGIAAYVWGQKHATETVTTKTVVVSSSPSPSANAGPGPSTMEKLVIPIDSLAAGYSLTLQTPTAWRTVDIRSLVYLDNYESYNANDLAALLRFVPDHPERNKLFPTMEPINRIDVLGTANWVTKSDGFSSSTKQGYLQYLGSLKSTSDIATKKCSPVVQAGSSPCVDKKVKAQIIQTADGSLRGLAYLYMQTQSLSYDPAVVVDMVGSVNGKPVRVSGYFFVYDKLYETLGGYGVNANPKASDWQSKVEAARKPFIDGNPSADTVAMYERVVAAVKSMRFDKK